MYLTAANLTHYLIDRGLADARAVVDGGLIIREAGRRNRNFKVSLEARGGLFVKQIGNAQTWEPILTLRREAAFYAMVQSRPDLGAVAGIVPRMIEHDTRNCSLVVELIADGENLTEHHHRVGTYPAEVGAGIGRAVARYQSAGLAVAQDPRAPEIFPRQAPWIFRLDGAADQLPAQFGAVGTTYLALLRQFPALLSGLLALGADWRFDSLMHGDMKWDNLVLAPPPPAEDGAGASGDAAPPPAAPEVRVVDWELCDIGDAAWDAGSVFAAYLVHWALIGPASGAAMTPERFQALRRAMGAFWLAYAGTLALPPAAASDILLRCLRFAGARLAFAVFEWLYGAQAAAPALTGLLQTGQNMLIDPVRAASDLLSFEVGG